MSSVDQDFNFLLILLAFFGIEMCQFSRMLGKLHGHFIYIDQPDMHYILQEKVILQNEASILSLLEQ